MTVHARFLLHALLALACTGCDPIRVLSASRTVDAAPARDCILDALRAEDAIVDPGLTPTGEVRAKLVVVPFLQEREDRRRRPARELCVYVREEGSGWEVELEIAWIGERPSDEYRLHVERVLAEILGRLIARCAQS